MKKAALVIALVFVMYAGGCEQKESVRTKGTAETKSLKKHIKKKVVFTEGEKDQFHPKSSFESIRKSRLTVFGRLNNSPPALTPDEDTVRDALNKPEYRPINIIDFVTRTIDLPAYPFDYENDIDALKKLYKTHDLGKVISAGMPELDKLAALMVYTYGFLEGGRTPTAEEKWNITGPSAETITKLRREEGIGGTSEHYAALFCQLSLSCGFNARMLSMHSFNENGNFLINDVCEVYLNGYNKWAVFDTYNRATYYLRERIPLSALELRNLMLEDRYREIIPKSGIGDFADVVSVREKLLPRYLYIYMWRMNDILGKSKTKKLFPWQALYQAHLVWEDEYTPVSEGGFDRLDKFVNSENPAYPLTGVKYVTHEKSDYNWNLNNVTLHIARTGEESGRFYLDTMTPNFDHFLVYQDGKPRNSRNIVELQPILGDFLARSVNKFGSRGPISTISILP